MWGFSQILAWQYENHEAAKPELIPARGPQAGFLASLGSQAKLAKAIFWRISGLGNLRNPGLGTQLGADTKKS